VVPDLFEGVAATRSQDVLFLLDTSGSMAGASIGEARAALRLCLRQLREGDRFNAIAFNNRQCKFSAEPVPFTQKTLSNADRWIDSLAATGGTELLPALMLALESRPEVLMLLTDGQGVIALAPGEGILHPTNVLDTLGADAPEGLCKTR